LLHRDHHDLDEDKDGTNEIDGDLEAAFRVEDVDFRGQEGPTSVFLFVFLEGELLEIEVSGFQFVALVVDVLVNMIVIDLVKVLKIIGLRLDFVVYF